MVVAQPLFKFLDDLKIKYQTHSHKPVFTVDEAVAVFKEFPPFGQCKNLFLKDSKKNFWLVVALFDTQIKLKDLSKIIHAPELRFANENLLQSYLGVTAGSVTLFGLINDKNHVVNVVLDKGLFDHQTLGFHPLTNDATTFISPDDLRKFISALGNKIQILNFNELK